MNRRGWPQITARLLAASLLLDCRREQSAPDKREPVGAASANPKAPIEPKPNTPVEPKKPIDDGKVMVTTNRLEIPRTGHDPIVLELPIVKGLPDPKIGDDVNGLLASKSTWGESLDELRAYAKTVKSADDDAADIQSSKYVVTYNDHDILQIDADIVYGVPHFVEHVRTLVDLQTGEVIGRRAFRDERIMGLIARLDVRLKAEVKASDTITDKDLSKLLHDAEFDGDDLDDMGVSDAGVTFHHDYRFPGESDALQPAGQYFVAWADLAQDLDPKGPLVRIHPVP